MLDFMANPALFWFTGSFMTLIVMAISRMFSPRGQEPYEIWSREYWEDGFYIFFAWPGVLLLVVYNLRKRTTFRYG